MELVPNDPEDLTAVILAGGYATRLNNECLTIPKTMLSFNEIPFIHYLVHWLIRQNIKVIISAGHLADVVIKYFNDNFGHHHHIQIVKETQPLGTGGAVRFAAQSATSPYLFVCMGDTVVDLSIQAVLTTHRLAQSPITAVVTRNPNVPNQGAIEVVNGKIKEFKENGQSRELTTFTNGYRASSTGCYIFNKNIIEEDTPANPFSLEKEYLPLAANKGWITVYNNEKRFFLDFGTSQNLQTLQQNSHILTTIYGAPPQPVQKRNG